MDLFSAMPNMKVTVECQDSLSAPRARTQYVGLNSHHPKCAVDFTCVFLPFTGGKKNQVMSPNNS